MKESPCDRPVLPQDAIEVVNYFLDLRNNCERFLSVFGVGSIEKQYLKGVGRHSLCICWDRGRGNRGSRCLPALRTGGSRDLPIMLSGTGSRCLSLLDQLRQA